jgi:hypothetical protein
MAIDKAVEKAKKTKAAAATGFIECLSKEGKDHWAVLTEYYQQVFVEWLKNGFNAMAAVKTIRPSLTESSAKWMGWSIINHPDILALRSEWREKMRMTFEEVSEKVLASELAALEAKDDEGKPNHPIRLKAARQIREFEMQMAPNININVSADKKAPPPTLSPIADLFNMAGDSDG